jgi:hypothetical protein
MKLTASIGCRTDLPIREEISSLLEEMLEAMSLLLLSPVVHRGQREFGQRRPAGGGRVKGGQLGGADYFRGASGGSADVKDSETCLAL